MSGVAAARSAAGWPQRQRIYYTDPLDQRISHIDPLSRGRTGGAQRGREQAAIYHPWAEELSNNTNEPLRLDANIFVYDPRVTKKQVEPTKPELWVKSPEIWEMQESCLYS